MNQQSFYIAFEGPIAAGKTTLAKLFARHSCAELVLEEFESNAFLADYYSDSIRWALPMQLSFLATRHEQLFAITRERSSPIVADHTYAKDAVFARALLEGRELALYEALQKSLSGAATIPDVVIYLDAPNDALLERIRLRGRKYEISIDGLYLDKVRRAYEAEFFGVTGDRAVRLDTSGLDINSAESVIETLLCVEEEVRKRLHGK